MISHDTKHYFWSLQKMSSLFVMTIFTGFYIWLASIFGPILGLKVAGQNQYTICKCLSLMKNEKMSFLVLVFIFDGFYI